MTDRASPDEEEALDHELTLERYAEALAHLSHFRGTAATEVLERLRVSPEVWSATMDRFSQELAAEREAGGEARAALFGAVFRRAQARLRAEQPPFAALGRIHAEHEATKRNTDHLPTYMRRPAPDDALSVRPPSTARSVAIPEDADHTAEAMPILRAVMPFVEASDTQVRAAMEELKRSPMEETADGAGMTATLPTLDILKMNVMPFDARGDAPLPAMESTEIVPVPRDLPQLTVDQHACLRAELAQSPTDLSAIYERYGLATDDAIRKLEARWSEALKNDPKIRANWQRAYFHYAEWFRQRDP